MLRVHLFGKFRLKYDDSELDDFSSAKAQELLSYLLLNRNRSSTRERVASVLWGDHYTTRQSKKYLRHTIWQIHSLLRRLPNLESERLLRVEPNWIRILSDSHLWLDVSVFEDAYELVKGKAGSELNEGEIATLKRAVDLYVGDLLEGWYQEWCLYERERLLQTYLVILDKLIESCEAHDRFEDGLAYGQRILAHDHARECTHQQMMRLYAKSGDRTRAIRQYHQCKAILKEELDVATSERTDRLFERIKRSAVPSPVATSNHAEPASPLFRQILSDLRQLQCHVMELQHHVYKSGDPPRT